MITRLTLALALSTYAVTAVAADAPAKNEAPADDGDHHQTAKGAAAGAVAGHFAGHHAVTGAIIGGTAGAIKKHHDKKKAKKEAKAAKAAQDSNAAH